MIEQIQFAKLFGVAHIDSLLQEMLLGGVYLPFYFIFIICLSKEKMKEKKIFSFTDRVPCF